MIEIKQVISILMIVCLSITTNIMEKLFLRNMNSELDP